MAQIMPPKDPSDSLDYVWDWSTWLGVDTIASFVLTVPAGLTQPVVASNTTTKVTAWFGSGTADVIYQIPCKITTAAGRVKERSIYIPVAEQ